MSLIISDRVVETTTTTGTGALALAGAVTGFRAFSAVMTSPNDTCYYLIEAIDGSGNATGDWESGLGTYSASNTLTRTTVIASSNAGAAVNLSAGTKRVMLCAIALQLQNVGGRGNTFPASPSLNDIFYRSDRNIEYYYDGTRWLSTQLLVVPLTTQRALNPITATTGNMLEAMIPYFGVYDFYIDRAEAAIYQAAASTSNYFTVEVKKSVIGGAEVVLATFSSQNQTVGDVSTYSQAIGVVANSGSGGNAPQIYMTMTETGAQTGYFTANIIGRLVG